MYTLTISLPPQDHKARPVIDAHQGEIAYALKPENRGELPFKAQALIQAQRFIADSPERKSVYLVCIDAKARVELLRVGPRGGWIRLWVFGTLGK